MRTLTLLLAGMALGTLVTLVAVMTAGGWYEYRIVTTAPEFREMVNQDGWEFVSAQGATAYLRRARYHLP